MPATTPGLNIPYMLDTDPMADVAQIMQALAERLAQITPNTGSDSVTSNASGQFTIPHGLGRTPTWAHATIPTSSVYFCNVVSLNATNVTFLLVNRASGATGNTSVSVRWAAA